MKSAIRIRKAAKLVGPSLLLALSIVLSPSVGAAQSTTQGATNKPLYQDATQPVDARVEDLLGRMTLDEKITQLTNASRQIKRLDVPAYNWWSEALHGVAYAGRATVFPEPIGLGATFNPPLVQKMALTIGLEARVKFNIAEKAGHHNLGEGLDFWAPNLNIFRDPRWGRGQETYGEDPWLTGRFGVAYVKGLQGDDPRYYLAIATPKHFAVHSGPESTRHTANVEINRHDVEDTYLPAFRAAIVEGRAGSVMCAYNRINGEPACANNDLLMEHLRGAWRFNGYVVSDCGAVNDIADGHQFAKSKAEAGAVALARGMDNECSDFGTPTDDHDYAKYREAVQKGVLSEKTIDVVLRRLLTARFRLGLFDDPAKVRWAQTPESVFDGAEHRALALELARQSMVLLKNDGALPLAASTKKILVVGPLADSTEVLAGNYHGNASRSTSVLEGVRKEFSGAEVSYLPGMNFLRRYDVTPASVFTTPDGKPGLKADYFAEKIDSKLIATRVDALVNINPFHDDKDFVEAPTQDKFAARWTGFLTAPETGSYEIGMVGSMSRLYLDGKLVVDASSHDYAYGSLPKTVAFNFVKGRRYAVKAELVGEGFVTRLVWRKELKDPVGDAVAAAKNADVVIAVVGLTSQLEGEEMKIDIPGFKGGDRTSLDLPAEEEKLLEALKGAGKPVVVTLMNGSALGVNWAAENSNAILEAWYPGEEGGAAVAQTLSGANNPAGRLPLTFYKSVDQLPAFDEYAMANRTYRYFTGEPLYRFGYGLSYSSFAYSGLKLASETLNAGEPLRVEVDVKNTSAREGDEVAELYITFPKLDGAPQIALRGAQRVALAAGEMRHLVFELTPRDLSHVSAQGEHVISAGDYKLFVGGAQPGPRTAGAEASLAIIGEAKLPE